MTFFLTRTLPLAIGSGLVSASMFPILGGWIFSLILGLYLILVTFAMLIEEGHAHQNQ